MITYRNATLKELDTILEWAALEGWNPGLEDAHAFFAADPKGFFVATDQKDEPIASISVVNHTSDFAFLGLYIVTPAFRGKGTGFALWQHALDHAGGRTIGLDGVETQQENYRISGFKSAGGTTRFTGHCKGQQRETIRKANEEDFKHLVWLEGRASGVEKPKYLTAWFSNTATRTTFVLETQNEITGFATIRACRSGSKIGPLVATDATVARHLISHAATKFDGPVTVDAPNTATGLKQICHQLGLEPGFQTARMYKGELLDTRPGFFAVTTLELG